MKSKMILLTVMALPVIGLLAGSAFAQVDPKLNPPGPPGPTMKKGIWTPIQYAKNDGCPRYLIHVSLRYE